MKKNLLLSFIVSLLFAGCSGSGHPGDTAKSAKAANAEIITLAKGLTKHLSMDNQWKGASAKYAVTSGIAPQKYVHGNLLVDPWGSPIIIASRGDMMQMILQAVPYKACQKLALSFYAKEQNSSWSLQGVRLNKHGYMISDFPISTTQAKKDCHKGNNIFMVFFG